MTRIKYNELGNELVTDWFTVGPNFIIRGVIDTKSFEYKVIEFDSGLIKQGQALDVRTAKVKLKDNLKKSGVIFYDEIRKSI